MPERDELDIADVILLWLVDDVLEEPAESDAAVLSTADSIALDSSDIIDELSLPAVEDSLIDESDCDCEEDVTTGMLVGVLLHPAKLKDASAKNKIIANTFFIYIISLSLNSDFSF